MAIIYSYPYVSTVNNSDTLVISVSDTTADNGFLTKSLTADNLASYVTARVNLRVIAQDTTNTVVNLDTQNLTITGTTNEIETTVPTGQMLQVGLPDNVTITNNLTIGGDFTGDRGIFAGIVSVNDDLTVSGLTETGTLDVNTTASIGGDTSIGGSLSVTNTLVVNDNQGNGSTIDSLLSMSANRITNLSNPTGAQDAATKSYVDTLVSGGLSFRGSFRADTGEILSGANAGSYLYNCPGGAGTRISVLTGDYYIVANTGGNFYCSGDLLNVGDSIMAVADAAADSSTVNDWATLESDNVEGTGVANTIPLWTDSQVLGNSVLSEETGTAYGTTKNLVVNGNIYQSNMGTSVSIGENALANGTAGTLGENVAIGKDSLNAITTGTNNIGIGVSTLLNASGNNNIAVGKNSLKSLTGIGNLAFGFDTLGSLTTSDGFVAIGHMAADSVTVGGGGAVVIGNMASKAYTGSIGNAVVIGENALQGSTTLNAANTVIIGTKAAQTLSGTTAQGDVVIGSNAFQLSNSSGNNIIVGYNALPNKSTAVENAIHMFADASSADTNSYAINIGTYDIADAGIGNPSRSLAKYGVTIGGIDNVNEGETGAILGGRSNTIALGADNAAILGGFDNSVTSVGSAGMALGSNLLVQGANQVVVGRYNVGNNNSKLIVGAGFSNANRVNAFEVKNTSLIKLGKYGQSSPTFPVIGTNYNILVTQPNNEVREVDPVAFDSQLLIPQSVTIGGGQVVSIGSNPSKLITVSWTGTFGTGTLRLPPAGNFTNKTVQILAADGFDPLTIPSNLRIETSLVQVKLLMVKVLTQYQTYMMQ